MANLTICRNPSCLIAFDPNWRVSLEGEPAEVETVCPRCGWDLSLNGFIRRPEVGEKVNEGENEADK